MNILIVDDSSFIRNMVIARLKRLELPDVQLLEANGSKNALSIMLARPISVLICDLYMPEMTGMELMQIANGVDKKFKFIFLTSEVNKEIVADLRTHGAFEVLRKPPPKGALEKALVEATKETRLI